MDTDISVEDVRAFITDAEKYREDWLKIATRSWQELKKRQSNGKLFNSGATGSKRGGRYPAWYSIFKIRQPLLLSRVGIPIGKDTTQDGLDTIGATAALCYERLVTNISRTFDFFDVLCTARDDFLATCFGTVRAYYERDEVKENVKSYLQVMQVPGSQDYVFIDEAGKIIESDNISQDEEGYFVETSEVIDVENEKICLEPTLYRDKYVDPDIRRWNRCRRLAFAIYFSEEEFRQTFGADALLDLKTGAMKKGVGDEDKKAQRIKVFEYWDKYKREVKWLAEHGSKFIEPKGYYQPDPDLDGEEEPNGLYNLKDFFPTPKPLMSNQATDEFWPIPEYAQLQELFADIHTIFSRMMALTKAIRARLLFDNNVEGLQAALNEATEGDAFGVPNLAQALAAAGGSLENVVQYVPTDKLIESLNNLYIALEQRLNVVYKLSGTSDLLQGLITDPTQRTFGERQMTEKYALNQMAEPQRKMQEFVRDCYELLGEMAIKNFKDKSLEEYIMPKTLPDEHKGNFAPAMELLKNNRNRFRIELETDSTIALNEEYDKAMRVEMVNALTTALEKTAQVAQQSPALVIVELHALKYLIQGYRQGKMFQAEITEAIDNVVKMTEEAQAAAAATPPFDKDREELAFKREELQSRIDIEFGKAAGQQQLEAMQMAQEERFKGIDAQLQQMKLATTADESAEELKLKYQELGAEIAKAQQEMALKRDELLVEIRKVTDQKEMEQFKLGMEGQLAIHEQQLAEAAQQLNAYKVKLDLQEKIATEQRLQAEHELDKMTTKMDVMTKFAEMMKPPEPPVINVTAPEKKSPTKRRVKVERNDEGLMTAFEAEDVSDGS